MTRPRFIIHAPSFDDRSGGAIALHLLCSRLREMGEDASIAHAFSSVKLRWPRLRDMAWAARQRLEPYSAGPFANPLAREGDVGDAIVVYPESVVGNPLKAANVVRWMLNKPGTFTKGVTRYGADDLFFFFQAAFDDPAFNSDPGNQLMLQWVNPIYRDLDAGPRAGSCHLMRKGAGRPIVHDAGSIAIDGLSHEEKARVLNETERFYCYDLYTFYTIYAAICGCVPIVVPDPLISKEEWIREPRDRYGVAYGEDDADWAVSTRPDMLRELGLLRAREDEMLARFVAKCKARFASAAREDVDLSPFDAVPAED